MTLPLVKFPTGAVQNYKSFRRQIRDGDLMFCSGTRWTSELIQRMTNSCWSHVAFVMRLDAIDRVVILESVESVGVRAVPLSKYLENYHNDGKPYPGGIVLARHEGFARQADQGKLRSFGEKAVDLLGYAYSVEQIARIALKIASIKGGFSRNDRTNLIDEKNSGDEYVCSEYVDACYLSLGIKIDSKYDFITPADFARTPEVKLLAVLQEK